MTPNVDPLIDRPEAVSSPSHPESNANPHAFTHDWVTELLLGMRLSGVQYRRMPMAVGEGLGFENDIGRAQFHFIGHGRVWLRSPSGALHAVQAGDALLIPRGGRHALLTAADLPADQVMRFSEAVERDEVRGQRQPAVGVALPEAILFSCCMEFELGGMQPLVALMPEVMQVSPTSGSDSDIEPMLKAMERETLAQGAGSAGILARLADVVAALIVRGWAAAGCGVSSGWAAALRDPRLGAAFLAMHRQPSKDWSVADLAREARQSRSVFARRFLAAAGVPPWRYLTELRMRLAVERIARDKQSVESVAYELGYGSLAAFSRAFKRVTGRTPGAVRAGRE